MTVDRGEVLSSWKYFSPARVFASLAALAGLACTGWLTLRTADSSQPASAKEALAIAGFAAIAQLLAAYAWSRIGRSDPVHSVASVRRLATAKGQVERLLSDVEYTYENGTARELKIQMGRASSSLEFINESILDSIADWAEFNQELLADKLRSAKEGEHLDG